MFVHSITIYLLNGENYTFKDAKIKSDGSFAAVTVGKIVYSFNISQVLRTVIQV